MRKILLVVFSSWISIQVITGQKVIPIWKGTGVVKKKVTMTEFLPENGDGTAVIICPGGSYCWLSKTVEGTDVAKALNEYGIAAYVLHYRTAGWAAFAWHTRVFGGGNHHPYMIQDLQRAIMLVKKKYKNVGLMGFSAGGHLVLTAAEYYRTNFLAPLGIVPEVSLRPAFVAAVYPVVSFTAPCTHRRSRRGLLGEYQKNDPVMRDSLSMELHAQLIDCPVFITNCKDDPIVKFHNSELLDSALTIHHKDHLYVPYPTGGHGFGVSKNHWLEKWIQYLRKEKNKKDDTTQSF